MGQKFLRQLVLMLVPWGPEGADCDLELKTELYLLSLAVYICSKHMI